MSEVEATGNYSYASDLCQGDNFILLGDAFAFIDPVFSSGVWLAMNSAATGVEVVEARLREPAREPLAARASSIASCAAARSSSRGSSTA